jgi:hypothetical protein
VGEKYNQYFKSSGTVHRELGRAPVQSVRIKQKKAVDVYRCSMELVQKIVGSEGQIIQGKSGKRSERFKKPLAAFLHPNVDSRLRNIGIYKAPQFQP